MKNIILIIIVILLVSSCISVTTEELIIEGGIEYTVETTNITLDKLGEEFEKLDYKVGYELIDENNTKIEISSKINTLNTVRKKAIEQSWLLATQLSVKW